jgi:hypothetical protein
MERLAILEKKLKELDAVIRETEKRLPAHSVKPPVMMDLLAYEDEYERVSAEIRRLKAQGRHTSDRARP